MKLKMKKIYEKDRVNDNKLWTRTIIRIRDEELRTCLVPRWAAGCYCLTLTCLLAILIAACVILLGAKSPANYLESCAGRSCNKDLGMKCINKICTCTDSQYYTNKCYEKKAINELCSAQDQCKDGLNCIGGKCQCNETYYHNGAKCLKRKTYQETCQGDQCLTQLILSCDKNSGKCVCVANRQKEK